MGRMFSRRYLPAWARAGAACVIVLLLVFAAPWASKSPDSVEKVARDTRLAGGSGAAPAKDYKVPGVKNPATSTRLSALIGVVATLVLAISAGLILTGLGKRRAKSGGRIGPSAGRMKGGRADEA